MKLILKNSIFGVVLAVSNLAQANGGYVYFEAPLEDQIVKSPVKVIFGLAGKKIGPVGDLNPDLGHHHLIINGGPIPTGKPVPADAQHIHYGKGQTETTLNLSPGDYQLTLQFANGAHQSFGPEMSKTVRITVVKP
jgi:hypothetical protein